jgi:Zn-dependent protease with chaperone function
MSSKGNDEATGLFVALGFIGAIFLFWAALIFALLAFLALVFTVLCCLAWNKPFQIGSWPPITPEEAHAFVWRGVAGALLLPVFAAFVCLLFGLKIQDPWWFYLLVGGYTVGSVGVEIIKAQEEAKASAAAQAVTPQQPLPRTPQKCLPPAQPESSGFASWDDEEEGR